MSKRKEGVVRRQIKEVSGVAIERAAETGPVGSTYRAFEGTVIQQAVNSNWFGSANAEDRTQLAHAVVGGLEGLRARDEVEGMLGAQMIATHNAAMECFRRAMLPEQPHIGRESNLNHAGKLVRSYATLVQALDKHRSKGQQTVRVEHVHVYSGGQAIVGSVTHGQLAIAEEAAEQTVRLIGEAPELTTLAPACDPIPFPVRRGAA